MARYWTKVADFNLSHLFTAPLCGDPIEFHQDLLYQETRVPGYRIRRYLRDDMFSHFERTATCDSQTDRRTDRLMDVIAAV